MKTMPTLIVAYILLISMIASAAAESVEVYHWVDENGVAHYSQEKPADAAPGIKKIQLEDTRPADFDAEEDRYGVEEQAMRMAELRQGMQQRREEARERQRNTPQPPVIIYQQPYQSWSNRLWVPPLYPGPPVRPKPPIAVPYRTGVLAPR